MATNPPSAGSSSVPDHILNGPMFLGHPKGLFLLFLVEMWERFSYYGMRGLLVLYLTAAVAAHQMVPGTYTNTLSIDQTIAPTKEEKEQKKEFPTTTFTLPMSVTVGDSASAAPASEVKVDGSMLKFERLKKVVKAGGKPEDADWVPDGAGLSSASFSAKPEVRPDDDSVRFRVTNPTDREVKLTLKVERPYSAEAIAKDPTLAKKSDPEYKTFFKVNDGTSVVSTTIRPDAKRAADQKPYEITIDLNRVDSGRSWMKSDANTLYGWYTGMAYLLPIVGGLIADKLIGTHRSMVVGGILIALGHIILGVSGLGTMSQSDFGMSVFVGGLALITIGTGHFKPSVSVMVGQLYPLGDPRRESAFSIFYMGINLGSFLCNLVCGVLAVSYGWHYGFGAAAIGMILGLGTYIIARPTYLRAIGEPLGDKGSLAPIFLPLGLVGAAVVAGLFHAHVLRQFDDFVSLPAVFISIIVAAIAYAIYFIAKQEPGDRGPVATIFIYMLFNAVFWLSFEQAGSSLNTFTDEQTDRVLAAGVTVPTAFFQSLNPLLIIIFAPIFGAFWAALARKKKSIGQPYKIGLGLIFVGLGYVVMVLAAMRLNLGIPKVSMIYICGCYFLHTVGEIILSPTGLSYVAKTAPKKDMSSLMGIWFLSSFVAGLAAGKVGALVDPIIEGEVKLPWASWSKYLDGQASFFFLFVISSVALGLIVLLAGFWLTKLQRNTTD